MSDLLAHLPIELLEAHPHNPRGPIDPATVEELAASIREKGILEPLLVVPIRNSSKTWKIDAYTVIAGHRRLAAAKLAGLETVPAIARELGPVEQEEIMLVENLQREDLTPLQEARAYQRLIAQGLTQADVGRRVGLPGNRIQLRLTILKLSKRVQELFDSNQLPVTLAPLLAKVESADRQERLAHLVASRRLTVPKVKEMVENVAEMEATEKKVDKSRAKPTTEKRETAEIVFTRLDAIAALEARNGDQLPYADLIAAIEQVCTTCGMGNFAHICAACPLPQFVKNLTSK